MNKTKIGLIIGIISITLIGFYFLKPSEKAIPNSEENIQESDAFEIEPADQIEVVHFHGTNQCFSCIKVGEYALKTIKEKFKEEYESGIIIFKEVNGELEENKEIVQKYGARQSSLFVNVIIGEKESISEDTTVWRLTSNEDNFVKYFEEKLNTLLGK